MCEKWKWGLALFFIVIWDIALTLILYHNGKIIEANPLLRGLVEHNPVGLVIVKIVPVSMLVKIAECRHIRLAFWLYLVLYCLGTLILNR